VVDSKEKSAPAAKLGVLNKINSITFKLVNSSNIDIYVHDEIYPDRISEQSLKLFTFEDPPVLKDAALSPAFRKLVQEHYAPDPVPCS
jgi:hypothetical protein